MTLKGLADVGLMSMGHFSVQQSDGLDHDHGTLILLGPDEPAFWGLFSASPEYLDGNPDPMDRWSRRMIDAIATKTGGVAYYPFGGPPFQPFYTWALRSGRAWASPIGFLVHDIAGLFASYRGAVWVPEHTRAQNKQVSLRDLPRTLQSRLPRRCPSRHLQR